LPDDVLSEKRGNELMVSLLLIEDDLKYARMVEKVLSPHDFEIHHAPTGLKGLQLSREVNPDIILVDINLPDLDGKVVALQLRKTASLKYVPVVAFTAEDSDRARRLAHGFGCDGFISKSIDTRAFPDQVKQIISKFNKGHDHDSSTDSLCGR
jgi:DNA-binding response OmpR family regulator